MTLLDRRLIKAGDTGIAYSWLRREDGRYVVYRTYGGATTVLATFSSEGSAKRDARRRADLDAAVRR
jgi:hypothetical protein